MLFRYGVVVLFGLSLLEEDEVLRAIGPRIIKPVDKPEEETDLVEASGDGADHIPPGGPIHIG